MNAPGIIVKHRGKAQSLVRRVLQRLFKGGAAHLHRLPTHVLAVEVGRVKQVIHDVRVASAVESVLQCLKVGQSILIEHHHFTVEPAVDQAKRLDIHDLLGQAGSPVLAVAGIKSHLALFHPRQNAVAIEFDFVHPVARGWLAGQGGKLRRKAVGDAGSLFASLAGLV